MDFLPAADLTVVFLSNLQSAAHWQIRQQLRNILVGCKPGAIADPPTLAPPFETPGAVVGLYGDPTDTVAITEVASFP
jgi:hypothetical protein